MTPEADTWLRQIWRFASSLDVIGAGFCDTIVVINKDFFMREVWLCLWMTAIEKQYREAFFQAKELEDYVQLRDNF